MKKIIFVIMLACTAFNSAVSQFEGEPDSKGKHALLQFGNTRLVITNNFVMPAIPKTHSPRFVQLPAGDIYYSVTGPRLQLTLHEKSQTGNFIDFSALDQVIDSSAKEKDVLNTKNIQFRISIDGKADGSWYHFTKPFLINGHSTPTEVGYTLIDTGINVNGNILVEFRDRGQKPLLTIHINRLAVETRSYLAQYTQDSSASHATDIFIQQQVNEWTKKASSLDSFYAYWSTTGLQLNNQQFYPSSRLAFYFIKPAHYTDSSLEYKLTGGEYTDTSWRLSSHLIIVPHLQSNSNYTLLVRYKQYPANIEKYTFYVAPEWYQKRAFIFFVVYPVAFFILFFTTIYFAQMRVKNANERKAKLSLELKSIRAQLNPHFVFNALSNIQALIHKNDIELADKYLTDFSNLLRSSLKDNDTDLVPASVDLKTMENYIKLEQLRFNFTYEINTESLPGLDTIDIPSLLLQPLIENAIKHGIAPLKENGKLLLEYKKQGDTLIIVVKDNGGGGNLDVVSTDKHGLRLTKERIQLLNKTLKAQFVDMNIVSNTNGTCVTLTFNHWL